MEILGKTIVFSEERKGYTFFRCSISTKLGEEGKGKNKTPKYTSLSLDLSFVGDKYNDEKMKEKFNKIGGGKHIAIEIKKGFLTVREYIDKDGSIKKRLVVNVLDCQFDKGGWVNNEKSPKATTSSDDEMPF